MDGKLILATIPNGSTPRPGHTPTDAYAVALLKVGDAPTLENLVCLASDNDDDDFTNALITEFSSSLVQDVAPNGIAIGKAILAHKYCDLVGISPHIDANASYLVIRDGYDARFDQHNFRDFLSEEALAQTLVSIAAEKAAASRSRAPSINTPL